MMDSKLENTQQYQLQNLLQNIQFTNNAQSLHSYQSLTSTEKCQTSQSNDSQHSNNFDSKQENYKNSNNLTNEILNAESTKYNEKGYNSEKNTGFKISLDQEEVYECTEDKTEFTKGQNDKNIVQQQQKQLQQQQDDLVVFDTMLNNIYDKTITTLGRGGHGNVKFVIDKKTHLFYARKSFNSVCLVYG
ncbi:hypothetical protein PPERSA_08453 [Pseudocohnilembus persalinus]|uniref:Protein kinase-like domain n=1 Tax=Pseudocohnilembus persalinus TaxID=266149 RepID=A0A0V0R6D3_PSEPJ|nr:hypothetical protein PPERSA_08453 [Pseudocohnilembus persalinus]|eukprot:KRX10050.1 hypothetical protein PPERSA_08453 [Pseudocohnilembus persalinus]